MFDVRHSTFSARLDCHYQVQPPSTVDGRTLLVVTLHGFGQTPEQLLPLTSNLVGRQHVIAVLEAPYRFYLPEGPGGKREIGCCWATPRHAPESVRLHH